MKAFEKAGVMNTTNFGIQAPLYVLTAIPQVAENLEKVFNFQGMYFNPDAISDFNLSTGQRILFSLAINLYNGHELQEGLLSPFQAMGNLDPGCRNVFFSALEHRFR